MSSVSALMVEAEDKLIPSFLFVEINCLRISHPFEAYTMLWRAISGEFLTAKKAEQHLSDYFRQDGTIANKNNNDKREHVVCLVDEIDFMVTKNEEVIYNFFSWSLSPGTKLFLIGVCNIMDLPERLNKRLL